MRNVSLKKILICAGLLAAVAAIACAVNGNMYGNQNAVAGIGIGIAALAFLKAAELLATKSV